MNTNEKRDITNKELFDSQWEKGPYGGTSDCYISKTDDKLFLKLFHANISKEVVEKEYNIAKRLHDKTNIHVPDAIEIIEYGGRYGIVFERIKGRSFAEMLKEGLIAPLACAEKFGKETLKIHAEKIGFSCLPSFFDEINLSIDEVYSSRACRKSFHNLLNRICEISKEDVFIHGDLHPGNLMETKDDCYWIDVGYALKGPALFDLTSSDIMLNFSLAGLFTKNQFGLSLKGKKALYTRFLETYFNTTDKKEIKRQKHIIRLYTTLYVCYIAYKENWQGLAKFGMKTLILITYILYKRYL